MPRYFSEGLDIRKRIARMDFLVNFEVFNCKKSKLSSPNAINENPLYSASGSAAMHPTSNILKATPIGTYRPFMTFNTL